MLISGFIIWFCICTYCKMIITVSLVNLNTCRFLTFPFKYLLLVYSNKVGFLYFTFLTWDLAKFINFGSFLEILRNAYVHDYIIWNKHWLLFWLLSYYSCNIGSTRSFSTVLNRNGKSGPPCLTPDFRVKAFSLLSWSIILVVGSS